jgi:hypothetical protein
VNTGQMTVHTGGTNGVALYVPFGVKVTGSASEMVVNGEMNIGGNFYQDGGNPAFKVNSTSTLTTSTGKVRFVKTYATNRLITSNNLATNYDRGDSYVAFPHVAIATNDMLVLEAKMGMDAKTLKRDATFTGKLLLKSDRFANNVYDASLRITGSDEPTDVSADLVDLGAVIVEREMSYYRSVASGNEKVFGFATPFKDTQLSGYFAGNWVRRPVANPATGHTQFIFGNQRDGNNTILASQYIYHPEEKLVPSQAYLIRPRPAGFTYQDLKDDFNGLAITDASNIASYDETKFTFGGQVYSLDAYNEQLFAENNVFVSPAIVSTTSTINWLIGNSYTAPISTQKLIDAMGASALKFSPYIWVLPAGATTYQSHKIEGNQIIVTEPLDEIPAMSIFMIRVLSGTAAGQFTIPRDWQRHAAVTHSTPQRVKSGMKAPAATYKNQVVFRVTPEDNTQIYDVAAIGLRADALAASDSYDMTKVYNDADVFQLFSYSSVNTMLSANGVPLETKSVRLAFKPVSTTGEFILTASQFESLQTEGLWLQDLKTTTIVDLTTNPVYTFESEPGDNVERFLVHFVSPSILDVDNDGVLRELLVYTQQDHLVIDNLLDTDMGSKITLLDASGRIVKTAVVDNHPRVVIPFREATGVYLMQLRGNRSAMVKYVNK